MRYFFHLGYQSLQTLTLYFRFIFVNTRNTFFLRKANPKRVFLIDKLGVFRNIRDFVRLNPSHLDQSLLINSRSDMNQLKIGKEIRIFDLSCS